MCCRLCFQVSTLLPEFLSFANLNICLPPFCENSLVLEHIAIVDFGGSARELICFVQISDGILAFQVSRLMMNMASVGVTLLTSKKKLIDLFIEAGPCF